MENTATKTNQEIIEKICNLKHYNTEISNCNKVLYIENEKTFIGIVIEKICSIEENETVFRINNKCFALTIWKEVKHIHLVLL
jgi:Mg2+/Co2+ transporter CorB